MILHGFCSRSSPVPRLRRRRPCGKDQPADARPFRPRFHMSGACCRSSVVEHSIGNGEVDSSILSGSTISSGTCSPSHPDRPHRATLGQPTQESPMTPDTAPQARSPREISLPRYLCFEMVKPPADRAFPSRLLVSEGEPHSSGKLSSQREPHRSTWDTRVYPIAP